MINNLKPLVTIGIPTYNRADSYLKDAIQSAVNQTYDNIEIIVSDNASTDNTEQLVKDFNDPRIRYYKQNKNIGMLGNSNYCMEQAKGDYFLLLCDDDLIDHDIVYACMDAASYDTGIGVILTGIRTIDEDGKILSSTTNNTQGLSNTDFMLSWFDDKVPLYLCSTLYNTNRLKENGGFKSRKDLYDDAVALFKLTAEFGRKDVRDVKASFRRHSQNIGTTAYSVSDWSDDSLYLLDIMCDAATDNKDLIRNKGMRYFCNQNYVRASRVQSPLKRFYAYMIVYSSFKYSYSPVRYFLAGTMIYQNVYRILRYIKRKTREVLSLNPAE